VKRTIYRHDERTPRDGLPYYCAICGLGFGEYLACEEAGCRLESIRDAETRIAEDSEHA